jgi:hypothetical protein
MLPWFSSKVALVELGFDLGHVEVPGNFVVYLLNLVDSRLNDV